MPEAVTTTAATVATVSFLGKDLVQKVLGPSSEYLGEQLKLFTQKNVENLKSIFEKAEAKLPEESENQGSVPPQIIRDVLFDGSFCEDEISQEYYAGVLAASKTQVPMDNIGKSITATIRNLSSFQLATHYLLYGAMWFNNSGSDQGADFFDNDRLLKFFNFPYPIPEDKRVDGQALIEHVYLGLEKYNLIKGVDELNRRDGLSATGQYHFLLTYSGIELFLWATGNGCKPLDYFYSKECEIYSSIDIDFNDFI